MINPLFYLTRKERSINPQRESLPLLILFLYWIVFTHSFNKTQERPWWVLICCIVLKNNSSDSLLHSSEFESVFKREYQSVFFAHCIEYFYLYHYWQSLDVCSHCMSLKTSRGLLVFFASLGLFDYCRDVFISLYHYHIIIILRISLSLFI